MVDEEDNVSLRAKRATLRDVGALAGVSFKTVSRVVNGEPGVSDELAARVRQAARQLNYRPNHTASVLRKRDGRSMSLGLIVEDVVNPFFAAIHRGLEKAAMRGGYSVLTGSVLESTTRQRELVESFASRRVDGLVVSPSDDLVETLALERRNGVVVVYIDRVPGRLDADTVVSDNRAGARNAVEHLLGAGHRRVAMVGDLQTIHTAEERYRGYVDAHAALGVPLDRTLQERDVHSDEAAVAAVGRLLDLPDRPTALFTAQNMLTVAAVRALRARALQHEVALVGFDDFLLSDLLDPPVTVVAQDPDEIGRIAAERMMARIEGDMSAPRVHVVPTKLLLRGSGELRPVPAG
jgi:LacI family transcriptional regulator